MKTARRVASRAASDRQAIPKVFCWTKMGAEAGQDLQSILNRKELERRAGEGVFAWGVGNSVAPAVALATRLLGRDHVDVLFSPMKSKPKEIDASPAKQALWLEFLDSSGERHPLPAHMLVTSRLNSPSGGEKQVHYALLCKSDHSLLRSPGTDLLFASRVRNLASDSPMGASQVTAVVRYVDDGGGDGYGSGYAVAFRARLVNHAFIRLVRPVAMTSELSRMYQQVCGSTTPGEWSEALMALRRLAGGAVPVGRRRQQTIFDEGSYGEESNFAALSARASSSS
jgi:hypothetical protein